MNREIEFRAWYNNGEEAMMFFLGDDYGTTDKLDCCKYAMDGQPVTLMQYTGLLDKNGVKIFEGDIVDHRWIESSRGVVEFVNGSFCVRNDCTLGTFNTSMEVIGNIYESPELLKGESK